MEDDNETIDTNIENYSVEDILEMLNLTDNSSEYQIKDAANAIISKMKEEGNEEISLFFQDALNKVLENLYNDNEQPLVTEADELKTYGDYTFNRLHSPDPQKENNSQPSDYDSKHEDDIKKSRID